MTLYKCFERLTWGAVADYFIFSMGKVCSLISPFVDRWSERLYPHKYGISPSRRHTSPPPPPPRVDASWFHNATVYMHRDSSEISSALRLCIIMFWRDSIIVTHRCQTTPASLAVPRTLHYQTYTDFNYASSKYCVGELELPSDFYGLSSCMEAFQSQLAKYYALEPMGVKDVWWASDQEYPVAKRVICVISK